MAYRWINLYMSAASGDDDNSGSSESVKVSGIDASTNGVNAIIQLPNGTDLSSVVAAQDTIRIDGRADGRGDNTDVFDITSVFDATDRVTVDPTPSSADNNQDWVIGGPFKTPQRGADVVQASDTIWFKADGTYVDAGHPNKMFVLKQCGTAMYPITLEGYKTTPGDSEAALLANPFKHPNDSFWDDYRATIDGENASNIGFWINALGDLEMYYQLRHLRATRFGAEAFQLGGDDLGKFASLSNCRGDHCQCGAYSDPATHRQMMAWRCLFDNNTFNVLGPWVLSRCDLTDWTNAAVQGFAVTDITILDMFACRLLSGGTGHGIDLTHTPYAVIRNCLVDGAGTAAPSYAIWEAGPGHVIENCIIHDWYLGIGGNPDPKTLAKGRYNVFSNVTVPRVDYPECEGDVVTADVGFVDEAGGDFSLRYDSVARGAGSPQYLDIGPCPRREIATHPPTCLGVQR